MTNDIHEQTESKYFLPGIFLFESAHNLEHVFVKSLIGEDILPLELVPSVEVERLLDPLVVFDYRECVEAGNEFYAFGQNVHVLAIELGVGSCL